MKALQIHYLLIFIAAVDLLVTFSHVTLEVEGTPVVTTRRHRRATLTSEILYDQLRQFQRLEKIIAENKANHGSSSSSRRYQRRL